MRVVVCDAGHCPVACPVHGWARSGNVVQAMHFLRQAWRTERPASCTRCVIEDEQACARGARSQVSGQHQQQQRRQLEAARIRRNLLPQHPQLADNDGNERHPINSLIDYARARIRLSDNRWKWKLAAINKKAFGPTYTFYGYEYDQIKLHSGASGLCCRKRRTTDRLLTPTYCEQCNSNGQS